MQNLIHTLLKNKKPLLAGILLLAIVVLFLGSNLMSLAHNKMEKHKLLRKNVQLDEEYQVLLHTKELLEAQDPQLLEKIARTQYGLAQPGEVEFRFQNK
ncbi:MAG: septum formation initiator family protein [Elusimicrobiaceae bacterium]|nr:septum formation initiator family protein [Elusimicrobiaceae bacterium]